MFIDDLPVDYAEPNILEFIASTTPENLPLWARVVIIFEDDNTMLVEIDKNDRNFQSLIREFTVLNNRYRHLSFKDCEKFKLFDYDFVLTMLGFVIPEEYKLMFEIKG